MKPFSFALLLVAGLSSQAHGFSMQMQPDLSRRSFFKSATIGAAAAAGSAFIGSKPALAAPEILKTPSGIKYAVTKSSSSGVTPQKGDIVAIEYTGYLTDGRIWDGTHAEGKNNFLLFNLGTDVVIDGINEMVSNMVVGQKVQAIIPPNLAFGDKGLCLDDGECLIKPGATLVYDISLKRSSIPPP